MVNKGWTGVLADFHFGPLAYVKMLSLSPSQVLPLQMLELSVRIGLWEGRGGGGWMGGKREEVWEDFHFKQAKLCPAVT